MSREKQIDEMAKDLCRLDCSCEECLFTKYSKGSGKCGARKYAERAIVKGYRKQSEIIMCKDCEHFYQVGDVKICRHWNYHATKDDAYCSYAKMKGGAE